ncbi:hypothetical protein COY23_03300 [bacterium (Candidatus Torokbacteria) CG_4_10_14_0_2_um_filter_35_8]|nr:MAG: hypothetical protein COY23_03300 [bacterium (Candidatus Torokbacteria) CG_4_10_14_0_2_um_filter_35_8]
MRYIYNIDPRLNIGNPADLSITPDCVFITGGIDSDIGDRIRNDILVAEANRYITKQTILPVVINSPGGDIYEMRAIRDLLEATDFEIITTIVTGKAMSAGLYLASGGTKGFRWASPNSRLMLHRARTLTQEDLVDEIDAEADLKELQQLNKEMLETLDHDAGQERGFFKKMLASRQGGDWFLSPRQAKKLGLIDRIGIPKITISVSVEVKYQ